MVKEKFVEHLREVGRAGTVSNLTVDRVAREKFLLALYTFNDNVKLMRCTNHLQRLSDGFVGDDIRLRAAYNADKAELQRHYLPEQNVQRVGAYARLSRLQ